jgi:hypothetical protein
MRRQSRASVGPTKKRPGRFRPGRHEVNSFNLPDRAQRKVPIATPHESAFGPSRYISRARDSIRYRTIAEVRSAAAVIAFNALDPQETFYFGMALSGHASNSGPRTYRVTPIREHERGPDRRNRLVLPLVVTDIV